MSIPLLILEAAAGPARRQWLEGKAMENKSMAAVESGMRMFSVSCDFDLTGPWAGVNDLFSAILPEMQSRRPDLVESHSLELTYILPELRRILTVQNPTLTDLAQGVERTRNYPADRASRNVHGLIDLLNSWKSEAGPSGPWAIVCDCYDNAGAMSSLFFRQLMRRRGTTLNLCLLLGVSPGQGEAIRASFDAAIPCRVLQTDIPIHAAVQCDPIAAERQANELEQSIGSDPLEKRINLSRLIGLWTSAQRPDKLLTYKHFALETYNTAGLYADALRYSGGLLELAAECAPENLALQWSIFLKLAMSHLGLDDVQGAMNLTEDQGLRISGHSPEWRSDLFYYMAMFYARFMKPRNLEAGEEYLERGLEQLAVADIPEGQRHFKYVFNRNGLAMIRTFQRRLPEAIEICRKGIQILEANLRADEHRLHRSVLYYNTAQVYHAIGSDEEAVTFYSVAMEMDPNYSEYHNERGNALLALGRLREAEADYLKAIQLSPPYFEVFTNLGQCYRRLNMMAQAIESYSRALDVEPKQILALLGRAKSYEETAQAAKAIDDYTAALALEPKQWEAVASRGVLLYEAGELSASLSDFSQAIQLKPEFADLYQNRATVYADLGRHAEAEIDFQKALALNPPAEDAAAIRAKLDELVEQNAQLTR